MFSPGDQLKVIPNNGTFEYLWGYFGSEIVMVGIKQVSVCIFDSVTISCILLCGSKCAALWKFQFWVKASDRRKLPSIS